MTGIAEDMEKVEPLCIVVGFVNSIAFYENY
jgi:hypothetical protein